VLYIGKVSITNSKLYNIRVGDIIFSLVSDVNIAAVVFIGNVSTVT